MRDRLANNRNGFTYAANITVLGFALIFFLTIDNEIDQFRYLCLVCLGLGFFTSLFYMIKIKEPALGLLATKYDFEYKKVKLGAEVALSMANNEENRKSAKNGKNWKAWLKEGSFYVHGMVYMMVRVAVNVTMTV
jgi:Na+/melibiose symporter-like transporter